MFLQENSKSKTSKIQKEETSTTNENKENVSSEELLQMYNKLKSILSKVDELPNNSKEVKEIPNSSIYQQQTNEVPAYLKENRGTPSSRFIESDGGGSLVRNNLLQRGQNPLILQPVVFQRPDYSQFRQFSPQYTQQYASENEYYPIYNANLLQSNQVRYIETQRNVDGGPQIFYNRFNGYNGNNGPLEGY